MSKDFFVKIEIFLRSFPGPRNRNLSSLVPRAQRAFSVANKFFMKKINVSDISLQNEQNEPFDANLGVR